MRLKSGYLDHAHRRRRRGAGTDRRARCEEKRPISVGLLGNAARSSSRALPARRAARPADRSDLRARSRPRLSADRLDAWRSGRPAQISDPAVVSAAARASMASHVHSMLDFQKAGVHTVDYGNNIRQVALEEGVKNAFDFPGFVPAYIRPLFCRGVGPFRWVALSGDPEDIARTDAKVKELMPDDKHLHHWLDMARERIQFQGLPARICWVGLGDRHRLGLAFNEMVASGELKAPDRHRPRSPRLGLGRLAESRDRSHEGRLGCRVRLAAAQCAVEHRLGRHLGVDPSRRRRRHGLLTTCRRRDRLRWHRRSGEADRTRTVERSGDRRHAPRRRGL